MPTRKLMCCAGIVILGIATLAVAKDFWDKPYREWKKKDVEKMLNDSPWSRTQTLVDQIGGKGSGVGGDKELYNVYVVRFFSSQPVREAYVRLMQLMNNYDSRSRSEKEQIDQRFSRVLNLDFSAQILVAMEFSTNDQDRRMRTNRFLENARADHLKQSCFLISDRLGRIELQGYFPPSPDGTGAKFAFPRTIDGKPVVTPEDKELKFELYLEPVNQKVLVTFKVSDLIYGEEVSI